ncbi:MAG: hypothetical protein FWF08_08405, partial [Oscillospiraceae bacterium]|nr:hypothetical protein [Oscillospiraceae bacterium]
MKTDVQKRRDFLITTAYIAVVTGLFYVFLKYVFWYIFPFLAAFLMASMLQPLINIVNSKTRIKKGFIATVAVITVFLIVLFLAVLAGAKIMVQIRGLIQFFTDSAGKLP